MDPQREIDTSRLRQDIEATRASLAGTAAELRRKAGEAMQWRTYVERYPAPILGGAAVVGLVVGRWMGRALKPNGQPAAERWWSGSPGGSDAVAKLPARVEEARIQRFGAASASWQRLAGRVEGLVNRVIDDLADTAERALVPAIISGVHTLLEGRSAPGGAGSPRTWDRDPVITPHEGRRP